MHYVSTRGAAPKADFETVLLQGLAPDGGLYVPESWPQISTEQIAEFAGKPYADVAYEVMAPFVGDALDELTFRRLISAAYDRFDHDCVVPLSQIGPGQWLLELFHGPTFAFKDVALQLLGQLFDHILEKRDQTVTIVGATSGDTGSAAIEAMRGKDRIRTFILHPKGRTSDIQRRQMTTVLDDNVHNIAIEGTFDDCQALVKDMFNDPGFRSHCNLSGVNSINWARVMAQVVYYFTSAVALGAPFRPIAYSVPTGNFGDIFAGYVAKQMGLSISLLRIATNQNDILARTLETGRYEVQGVEPSLSPSMDIQVSSNFERLLFDAEDRDGDKIVHSMNRLKQSGAFDLSKAAHEKIAQHFDAIRSSEEDTLGTIATIHKETGEVIDPHTAVGVAAAKAESDKIAPGTPVITLATAHAAKFGAAVEQATGMAPVLPARLAAVADAEERYDVLPHDLGAVQAYVKERLT